VKDIEEIVAYVDIVVCCKVLVGGRLRSRKPCPRREPARTRNALAFALRIGRRRTNKATKIQSWTRSSRRFRLKVRSEGQ